MLSRNQRAVALLGAFVCLPAMLAAQGGTTVTGRVTNAQTGAPLPNASVVLQGTRLGGLTDQEGRYSFTVPAPQANGQVGTLQARLIGYAPSTAQVTLTGASVTQDFALNATAIQLEGVVVTALGMTKEKSQLGTAQQQLSTEELTQTPVQSIVDAVSGKVSGVQITGSGTQGGSTNIVIRGQNSITGNNQPLFVVDGVPVSNFSPNDHDGQVGGDPDGGYDFGSVIADLNPNDIETMSVLKGPNAAALYGSRASNGAIIITTKRGAQGKIRTELNTTYTWERPSILWDLQNQYGQGAGGEFGFADGQGSGLGGTDGYDQSWGPKLDGRLIDQFTGAQQPWVAHPDNMKDFFNTGHTWSTSLAVSGGTDRANARLSIGRDNVEGYVPNNYFQKTTGVLSGGIRVNDRLNTTASLQYIRNRGINRPGTGYNTGILEQFVWFGRQVDINALRDYKKGGSANGGPANREFNWNYNYHNNPFWIQYENPERDTRDRFIGSVSATYNLLDWLNITARTGSDIYRFEIDQRWAEGNLTYADPSYFGAFNFVNTYNNENNSELLLQAQRDLLPSLSFSGTLGGNMANTRFSTNSQASAGIGSPGIYSVSTAAISPTLDQFTSRRRVSSVYGSASFTLNDWWTVEGTARNDWSSTLPKSHNSYFYPSVATSVVLTDAVPSIKGNVLSFLKLRGSVARVGNDANPYQLVTTFRGIPQSFAGQPLATMANALANPELKPEITTSSEAGVELGMFDGRVTFDASVYKKSTRDQIFNLAISPASGYSSKIVNAGQIDNKGMEALLTVIPVSLSNGFEWTSTFNYSRNRNEVVKLAPGVERIILGDSWYTEVQARVGEPYGAIYGYGYMRDDQGRIFTDGGIPLSTSERIYLGNIQPDWTGGWNNQFRYKNFSLNALLDIRRGGKIVSITNFFGDYAGITKASLYGREVDWNDPGVLFHGLDINTCDDNLQNCSMNADTVTAEEFFQFQFPNMEPYVYDANWIKLRELRLGVELPQRWARRMNAEAVSLAFIGRNLWTSTKVPSIDPEFSYTTGNYQGVEFAALPNARSLGFSLRITP